MADAKDKPGPRPRLGDQLCVRCRRNPRDSPDPTLCTTCYNRGARWRQGNWRAKFGQGRGYARQLQVVADMRRVHREALEGGE